MIYTNFFKDDKNINNEQSNNALDLLKLKNNPWNFFPNYNDKLDNALKKICYLKKEYLDTTKSYIDNYIILESDKDKKNQFDVNIVCLTFLTSIIIFFITDYIIYFSYPLLISPDNLISWFFTLVLMPIIPSYYFSKIIKRFLYRNKEKNTLNRLNDLKNDLNYLKNKYQLEVCDLIGENQELDIRKNLELNYHSNNPDINTITQYILEESYPKEYEFKVTYNIEDNMEELSKISSEQHINKISTYLNKFIDEKINSIITSEMEMENNLNNDTQRPQSKYTKI